MSEEQIENKEKIESKEQPKAQPKPKKKEKAEKKSGSGWILGILNFLFAIALAAGGYYLLQQTKDKQLAQDSEINKDDMREIESSKQFNSFQTQLATMQSQIATVNQEMAGKDNHFTKTLADFSQLHTEKQAATRKELNREITQLKRQLGKTRGDWLLADAEYLLSIANQRLHLVGDINTAKMALEAADQRLRESGDTAAYKVRSQVAKEISSLNTVVVSDVVGTYAAIQLLKDKVGELAVRLPYAGKPLAKSTQIHDHQQPPETEHGVLDSVIQAVEGYVTIKHSDEPVTKILTEEEVGFIRQQLNVKLEMIKISLVQKNDAIYKASIADSKQWVSANFTKNTQTDRFTAELNKLNSIPLSAQFPDVSRSLKMLKDITKLRIETDKSLSQGGGTTSFTNNSSNPVPASESAPVLTNKPIVNAPVITPNRLPSKVSP